MASRFNETRASAENGNNKLLDKIFARSKRKIEQEFKRVYTEAYINYDDTGNVSDIIFTEHKENIKALLANLIYKSLRAGSDRLLTTFKNVNWITAEKANEISKLKAVEFDLVSEIQAINEAKFIADTTKKDIYANLVKATEKNSFLGDELKKLLLQAEEKSIYRTLIVGFTNIHGSLNFGQKETIKSTTDADYNHYKIWVTQKDERVRAISRGNKFDHMVMEGVEVLENDKFIVTGQPMYGPGDRSASIGNYINCRCFLRYRRELKR